jgi:hypothetical protein
MKYIPRAARSKEAQKGTFNPLSLKNFFQNFSQNFIFFTKTIFGHRVAISWSYGVVADSDAGSASPRFSSKDRFHLRVPREPHHPQQEPAEAHSCSR